MSIHPRKLRKAFAVAALAAGMMVMPGMTQPAHAGGSVVAAVAAQQAGARRRADDRATSAAMVAPTDQNIQVLVQRGIIQPTMVPYFRTSLDEMKIPAGAKHESISESQRNHLLDIIQNHWRVGYVSATSS